MTITDQILASILILLWFPIAVMLVTIAVVALVEILYRILNADIWYRRDK